MSTPTMRPQDFEHRYRADPDPWNYRASRYERDKYRATLAACGPGPFARALELGGSIGVFSALLAPRCGTLVTIDASATAVGAARTALRGHPHANARVGVLPADLPGGPFDLVVASEILYYLTRPELREALGALRGALVPGGAIVAVHWRPRTPERELDADDVHDALAALPWLRGTLRIETTDYLLERLTCR